MVVDTSVWFRGDTCENAILALGAGIAEGYWSAQIVGELTRTRLWVGKMDSGRRLVSPRGYLDYRKRQYDLIAAIDEVSTIVRLPAISPTASEVEWAENDPDDLHVQLFARAVTADYVVSSNTSDFPNRSEDSGLIRGQLEGIIWITPAQIF